MAQATTIDSPGPVQLTERIEVLDVLRGMALFGMIIVHCDGYGVKEDGLNDLIGRIESLLFDDRFFSMFGFLFGAGFAIQLTRSKAKGGKFIFRFLRRMAALACFGLIAQIFLGYAILFEYAICGLLLLLVRNWSTKALTIIFFISVMFSPLYRITENSIKTALYGVKKTKQLISERRTQLYDAFTEGEKRAKIISTTRSYSTAVKLRSKNWEASFLVEKERKLIFLVSNSFMLMLLGFIAIRLKLFEELTKHRGLIASLMIVGAILWALYFWALPLFNMTPALEYPSVPFPLQMTLAYASNGFDIIRDNWLAFTYMGVIVLLVSYNPEKWLRRFRFFAWVGRMALTNYMLQALILSLTFSKYAFGLPMMPEVFMVFIFAIGIFVFFVCFSRWWLRLYQYGPLEWIWRSVTYWKKQPLRIKQKTTH
jgi:uncharacterized protein